MLGNLPPIPRFGESQWVFGCSFLLTAAEQFRFCTGVRVVPAIRNEDRCWKRPGAWLPHSGANALSLRRVSIGGEIRKPTDQRTRCGVTRTSPFRKGAGRADCKLCVLKSCRRLSVELRRYIPSRRPERSEDAAVGNTALSRTAVLDAAQLRRKPSQVGNFAFDLHQVVFRNAIDA